MSDRPIITEPSPPEDPFDRYKRASKSHRALQSARGKLHRTRELTSTETARLDQVEIALELAVVELESARDGYLYDPFHSPPAAPTIDESG
jgi:hypothetical protein